MKFKMTLEDSDSVYDTIREHVNRELVKLGLDEEEIERIFEVRCDKIHKKLSTWIKNNKSVTLEFDLDENTCTPVKNGS